MSEAEPVRLDHERTRLEREINQLKEQLEMVVVPDETGWKVSGLLHWLWVFATTLTTVYRICPGRDFQDAAAVLGVDFAGGLGRNGWAPYRQFTEAFPQACLAHLLRRCRTIEDDHPGT